MSQLAQMSEPRLQPNEAPPTDYYAQNLCVLIHLVIQQYSDILTELEIAYGKSILGLTNDACRLFARIVGRKVPVLLVDKLQYSEVGDRDAALEELETSGLIQLNECIPADIVLRSLTLSQLRQAFAHVRPCTPKAHYVGLIACRYTDWRIREYLRPLHPWLTLRNKELFERYLFLFFGDRATDLSAFVTRDLGILRYESYVLDSNDRQFDSREELCKYFEWASLSDSISESEVLLSPDGVQTLIETLQAQSQNRTLERYRSRILNRLGMQLERRKLWSLAFKVYRFSNMHPARERMARILFRKGRHRAVAQLKRAMLKDSWCREEEDFARRFREPRSTEAAFPIVDMALTRNPKNSIEQHALQVLTKDGGYGWHFENVLPLALFGLAYWDWMYVSVPGAFTNQFQSGPRDLFWPEFFEIRKQRCIDPLDRPAPLATTILETAFNKRGLVNRLVNWSAISDDVLQTLVQAIGDTDLRLLLGIVKSDLGQMRSGFPDLTLVHPNGGYEFVEVKAPGDQVQRNQRIWLTSLMDAGLPVRVVRFSNKP